MTDKEWMDLLTKAMRVEGMVKQAEQEATQIRQLTVALADLKKKRDDLKVTIDRCTSIYKDVKDNLDEKRNYSLDRYNESIRQAGSVVRNSDVSGAKLKVDGPRAVMVDQRGHSINVREGSALRSVAGMLLRYTSITAQMNYIPMILLDESFFTLSDNTSIEMKSYLQAFSEDLLIIGIEQRDAIFAGIPGVIRYEFVKDGTTKIRKEVDPVA